MTTLDVRLTPDHLHLNGYEIASAGPVAVFYQVLGSPSRVVSPGLPAPVGHRNNQIHIYDSFGLYLNEHHYTHQVSAVTFVFVPDESPFPTEESFNGTLQLGQAMIRPGMDDSALTNCSLPFTQRLRGSWTVEGGTVWIGVETKGRRTPSGCDAKRQFVVSVNACFSHDPWDERHRPG